MDEQPQFTQPQETKSGDSSESDLELAAVTSDRLSQIVARDRLEEQLWLSIYQSAWEESYDARIVFDRDGRIFRTNRKSRLMLRCGRRGLQGKSVGELIPSRLRTTHKVHTTEYLKDPTPRLMSEQRNQLMITVDGEEITVEISLSQLDTESGIYINAVIRHKRGVKP